MSAVLSIFKKEFKGFLFNPSFLIICGLSASVMSWIFPIQLNQFADDLRNFIFTPDMPQQQLNIHYGVFLRHLSYLNLILLFVVPALAMRMLAEEKKMKTMDLLLTSPVTSAQIVLGKYASLLGAVLVIIFIAFLYPASTAFFTKLNWLALCLAFFALFLVSAVYASMSLFSSALTESAILAYVMAVIFNISIWFIGIGIDVVDSAIARQVFEHISLNQHLGSMVEGTIRTSSLIFFLSVISLFVFLSERVVEASRWRS